MNPLVQMILGQPGMAARLLAEHVDDGSGRCSGCPVGGQRGRHSWPCTLSPGRRGGDEAAAGALGLTNHGSQRPPRAARAAATAWPA